MSNEIEKSEYRQGDLGCIIVSGVKRNILATKSDFQKGSLTLTIGAVDIDEPLEEDAIFEIEPPKRVCYESTKT